VAGKKSQKLYVGRIMEIDIEEDEIKTIFFVCRIPSKHDFIFIFPERMKFGSMMSVRSS